MIEARSHPVRSPDAGGDDGGPTGPRRGPRTLTLTLSPRKVGLVLGAGIVLLSVANVVGVALRRAGHDAWNLVPLTDVNHEQSVPTWFSALLLATGAVLMVVVSLDPPAGTTPRRWRFLAVLLAAMSADEVAAYHESWVEPVRDRFDTSGFLLQAWVVPALVLVAVVAVSQVRFLRALPRATARGLVLAAAVFLAGAVGMEMLGAKYGDDWGTDTKRYDAMVAVEEGLEMTGAALAITTLLGHIRAHGPRLQLRADGDEHTVNG